MTPIERVGYLSHAKSAGFRAKVSKSLALVEAWLGKSHKPYVAFSAGKDSTVALHLVRRIAPDLVALHSRADWELPETRDLLSQTPNLIEIAGRNQHTDWYVAWEDSRQIPEGVVPIETENNSVSNTWARANGYDGATIGIRAEENNYRKLQIKAQGDLFFAASREAWHCYPVAWWGVEDIWAYLLSQNVPYNRAYDRLGEIGVSAKQQRIGPFANIRALPYGQLALLKQGWPDLFEAFAKEHPQARQFV